MKYLFFFLISIISFGQKSKKIDLYENYKKALSSHISTAPSFLVIKYKNLNDNSLKEVCLESSDLIFAIVDEKKLNVTDDQIAFEFAISKKDRYFEFSNLKVIERISAYSYTQEELQKFVVEKDITKIAKKFQKEKKGKIYPKDELETIKYAHSLFNLGIIMGINNCQGMTIFCTNWSND